VLSIAAGVAVVMIGSFLDSMRTDVKSMALDIAAMKVEVTTLGKELRMFGEDRPSRHEVRAMISEAIQKHDSKAAHAVMEERWRRLQNGGNPNE